MIFHLSFTFAGDVLLDEQVGRSRYRLEQYILSILLLRVEFLEIDRQAFPDNQFVSFRGHSYEAVFVPVQLRQPDLLAILVLLYEIWANDLEFGLLEKCISLLKSLTDEDYDFDWDTLIISSTFI